MAVAFDAGTESHTGTTGAASVASFTWNHTGAASNVKGVLVFVSGQPVATDIITGVTYGGVAMTAVPSAFAQDTATEPGFVKAYFLGASVPQGTQAVVVSRTNNTTVTYAVAYTVTAAADTEATGVVALNNNQTPSEQNVDDGSPGADSLRFAFWYGGGSSINVAGANSTTVGTLGIDFTALAMSSVRETTPGQGARPVGFSTIQGNDDAAGVFLAVSEIPAGGNNWTVTPADGFSLTDAATTESGKTAALADTLGLTDARTFARTLVRAEAFGLIDARALTQGKALADAFGLTDAATANRGLVRALADALSLTDATTRVTGKGVSVADGFALTDARAFARLKVIADGFGLTDARAFARTLRLAETFGLTDARSFARLLAVAEALALTDSATPTLSGGGAAHSRSVADGFALTDAISIFLGVAGAVVPGTVSVVDILTAAGVNVDDLETDMSVTVSDLASAGSVSVTDLTP